MNDEPTVEQRQAISDVLTEMRRRMAAGQEIDWLAMPHEIWRAMNTTTQEPDGYAVLLDDKASSPKGYWFAYAYIGQAEAERSAGVVKGRVAPIFFAPSPREARDALIPSSERDTQRLDWIEANWDHAARFGIVDSDVESGMPLRQAIDDFMAEKHIAMRYRTNLPPDFKCLAVPSSYGGGAAQDQRWNCPSCGDVTNAGPCPEALSSSGERAPASPSSAKKERL